MSKVSTPEPNIWQSVNDSRSNPLSEMAYGLAGHAGTSFIDAGVSALLSGREQKRQRSLFEFQLNKQREMTRNQMADERASYEKAGLSPALLANGGFSPVQASTPSPAMQSVSGKGVKSTQLAEQKMLGNTLLEQKASIANLEAQTEGQKLKNDEQEIINDRLEDEDKSSDTNFREYLRETLPDLPDGPFKTKLQERLDNPEIRFTAGTVKNMNDFTAFLRSHSSYDVEQFANAVEKEAYKVMLQVPDVINAKAVMPYAQFKLVDAQIREISSIIAKYASEIKLNKSQVDVNKQVVQKLGKELALMDYELQSKKLSDSRYLIKHGEWGDLMTNVALNGFELGADVAKVLAQAYGYSKFMAPLYGSKTAKSASENLPKVTDVVRPTAQKFSAKELASIPLDQRKKMAQIEFNTYRYEHPRMGQDKLRKIHEKIGAKYGIFRNPQNRLRK